MLGACWEHEQAYGHGERVFDVQFHPHDSRRVASASEDCTVRVWSRGRTSNPAQRAATYQQVLCCYGHEAEVLRLGWSLDGRLLASGSADNTVRVWEVPGDSAWAHGPAAVPSYNGRQVALLSGHPEEVYHCEFITPGAARLHPSHPASTIAAAATSAGNSQHKAVGKQAEEGGSQQEREAADSCGDPGSHLLSASSESLFLWDLEAGVLAQRADAPGTSGSTIPPEAVVQGYKHAYVFACGTQPASPSRVGAGGGQLLACACSDGMVRLWALLKSGLQYVGCRQVTAGGGAGTLTALCWNTAGSLLAVTVKDGSVLILDTRKQLHVVRSLRLPAQALSASTLHTSCPWHPRTCEGGSATASPGSPAALPGLEQASDKPGEVLLLACTDGCLRACPWEAPEQLGGRAEDAGPCLGQHFQPAFMELRPVEHWAQAGQQPREDVEARGVEGPEHFSMLALAVSMMGDAIAMAGTPTRISSSLHHQRGADPGAANDDPVQPAPPAAASAKLASGSGGLLDAVVAAPSRRRRGQARHGPGAGTAAACAALDPGAAAASVGSGLQALDDAVHAMQLSQDGVAADAQNKPSGAARSAHVSGDAEEAGSRVAGEHHDLNGAPSGALAISVRAPVFVVRRPRP